MFFSWTGDYFTFSFANVLLRGLENSDVIVLAGKSQANDER